MENRLRNTKIWRLLAFIYDTVFILLLAFTVYMLFGMIFKLDSDPFQGLMIYVSLAIIFLYLFFGELIFKNTFGKYLFGLEVVGAEKSERLSAEGFVKRGLLKILLPVEGLVLLFSPSKKRLGDIWAGSIVANKENDGAKPAVRLIAGIAAIILLYLTFSVSLGLATKRTDFYKAGTDYLRSGNVSEITGLVKEVNQSRNNVDFAVPVLLETQQKYVRVWLVKTDGKWNVTKTEVYSSQFGTAYGYSFSSEKK
jgi:uncharacterized RDD family membrane protein YckC